MNAQNVIFAFWVAAPALFLLFALWAALERSAKNKATHPGEYLKHAVFLTAAGVVAYVIHLFVLDYVIAFIPGELPRNLYLLLLWPAILFFGAQLLGPSRDIMIEKAPDLARRRK